MWVEKFPHTCLFPNSSYIKYKRVDRENLYFNSYISRTTLQHLKIQSYLRHFIYSKKLIISIYYRKYISTNKSIVYYFSLFPKLRSVQKRDYVAPNFQMKSFALKTSLEIFLHRITKSKETFGYHSNEARQRCSTQTHQSIYLHYSDHIYWSVSSCILINKFPSINKRSL